MKRILLWILPIALFIIQGCGEEIVKEQTDNMVPKYSKDPHSFSNPNEAVVKHLDLSINLDFERKVVSGVANYQIENFGGSEIILDILGLEIHSVYTGEEDKVKYKIEEGDENGNMLIIPITSSTKSIEIEYTTSPIAMALQWLAPEQTGGKKMPFLYTQGQAILTRTWIPCQDSPGIRFTYNAKVKVPEGMMAVMSADNTQSRNNTGEYSFVMDIPVPSYLVAIAVGDIEFKAIGERTGVYCESYLLDESAYEFADMEKMLIATENMYGPYPWGRYDVIVLPPSFPFGGMENPKLTFATPTIIAGDRSLTSLIAHELAHSWSGNLVTNANWNDLWINEGFTVYLEQRIMEELYGREYAEMLSSLSLQELEDEIEEMGNDNPDTRLEIDLEARNPDDGFSGVPYTKGYMMLRKMEETFGRDKFDEFLKGYFKTFQFTSVTTDVVESYIKTNLIDRYNIAFNTDEWIHEPGLPESISKINSDKFEKVEESISIMLASGAYGDLRIADWSTHEWLHFIHHLPSDLVIEQIARIDEEFEFSKSGNSEILAAWLLFCVENNYSAVFPEVEKFLINVGRRKFLTPLYKELINSDDKHPGLAKDIYSKARANYHSVSYETLDRLFE
ncbi:MAG: M1 family metallopeptidase [Flavobacteriales bacterium]|nr:M1 family metallopeptidase [Flavobacteriales bacterium]